ncbi:hypothetical protein NMG46_07020 [Mesorhizobium sp. LMG 17147]|uniref:hypothetical protein n=1 Tax=Mesorhizobium sp. LMG 17147 TaxID=2963091 RepID=UPI0020C9DA83|nr:hypothetical protein [Mesorhizobium sp. LMG 17147]MCP9229996.1 hypothetical protein [Mesorhizobium sp. LMG 17147]
MNPGSSSKIKPLLDVMHRTRVTNGKQLFPGVDHRTLWPMRMRDVLALFVSDLGGAENCSEAEKAILRRAAALVVELERIEVWFAENDRGEGKISAPKLDLYQRMSNTLRRLLEVTGLERRTKDITPTLTGYLEDIVDDRNDAKAARIEACAGDDADADMEMEAAAAASGVGRLSPVARLRFVPECPKRKGTVSYIRWTQYSKARTVRDFYTLGGTTPDLRWDIRRGYAKLLLPDPADVAREEGRRYQHVRTTERTRRARYRQDEHQETGP